MHLLKKYLLKGTVLKLVGCSLLIFLAGTTNFIVLGQFGGGENGQSKTFIVNTEADGHDDNLGDGICRDAAGNCSLRAALQEANQTSAKDVIKFASTVSHITLTEGTLAITSKLDINGEVENPLTISGANLYRIFDIQIEENTGVKLENVILKDGYTAQNSTGVLPGLGGGILLSGTGKLVLVNVNIKSCFAEKKGGAIANFGRLDIFNGIFNGNEAGTEDLNKTAKGNETTKKQTADSFGGAVYNEDGRVDMINTLIFDNTAGSGGGILNNGGSLSIINTTITQNRAINEGGGLSILDIVNIELYNTILALNQDDTNLAPDVLFRTSFIVIPNITESHNLIGNNKGSETLFGVNNTNIIGTIILPVDPFFQDAANNNFRLQKKSPAYDTGDFTKLLIDSYDLDGDGNLTEIIDIDLDRGDRYYGSNVDMGAYERNVGDGIMCRPEGGDVEGNFEYCLGNPELNLTLEPIYEGNEPNELLHDYLFFIVNSDDYAIDAGSDLSAYTTEGSYLVCGLSYSSIYPADVPEMNGTNTLTDIRIAAVNGDFCGDVSDQCATVEIILNESCCPVEDDVMEMNKIVVADILCGELADNSSVISLADIDVSTVMERNYRTANATFDWLQTDGPMVDLDDLTNITLLPNDECDPITYGFDLQISCQQDESVALNGGKAEFTIYPLLSLQTGNLIEGDHTCCPSMLLQCPDNYSLINNYNGTDEAGNPSCSGEESVLFEFKIILNNPPTELSGSGCASRAFKAVQAISDCCPKSIDVIPVDRSTVFCGEPTGNTITLPSSNLATDDYAIITWQQTSGISVTLPEGDAPTITLPQNNNCEPIIYDFDLMIGCAVDEAIVLDGGRVTYTIYQTPPIAKIEDCSLTVVPKCLDEESNDLVQVEYNRGNNIWLTNPPSGPFESGEQVSVRAYLTDSPFEANNPVCATYLTAETEACCPTAIHIQPLSIATTFCSDQEPIEIILSTAGVVSILGATYTWTQIDDNEIIAIGTGASPTVILPENSSCTPKTYTFALTIGCEFDATTALFGGTVSYQVYSAPPITVSACSGIVVANCEEELDNAGVLIEYSLDGIQWVGSLPAVPFVSAPAIQVRAYVTGGPLINGEPVCVSEETISRAGCCPVEGEVQPTLLTTGVCSQSGGNSVSLLSKGVLLDHAGATYTWTQIDDNEAVAIGTAASPTVILPENSSCTPKTYTFALTIGCEFDATIALSGGTVSYQVYSAPPITVSACSGIVVANCEEELDNAGVLIEYSLDGIQWVGSLPAVPFVSAPAIQVRAYVTGGPLINGEPVCVNEETISRAGCCPVEGDVQPILLTTGICSQSGGNSVPLLSEGVLLDHAGATYTWTQTDDNESVAIGTAASPTVVLPENSSCTPKTYTFALTIGCEFDATTALFGGTVSYQVYSAPPITVSACSGIVVANCESESENAGVLIEYSLDGIQWVGSLPAVPFVSAPAIQVRAYVTGGPLINGEPVCVNEETISRAGCCPVEGEVQPTLLTTGVCSQSGGNSVVLLSEGVLLDHAGATYSWTQIDDNEIIAIGTGASPTVILPENSSCTPKTYTFALTIGCEFDATTALFGGTVSFVMYSMPQAPTINRLTADVEAGCTYEVVAACPDDVVTPNTFNPLSLPTINGTTLMEVSTGAANSICNTTTFEVSYSDCSLCQIETNLSIATRGEGNTSPFYQNAAIVNIIGGVQPFTYTWERTGYLRSYIRAITETELDIEIVYADNVFWSVTITDQLGCTSIQTNRTDSSTSSPFKIANIEIIPSHPVTENGGVNIEFCGGTSPYTYAWTGPRGFEAETQNTGFVGFGWYALNAYDSSVDEEGNPEPKTIAAWYWVPRAITDVNGGLLRGKQMEELFGTFQIFPNPAESHANIQFVAPTSSQQTELYLYAINGQKVATLFSGTTTALTNYTVNLAKQQLANGIYMVELVNERGRIAQTKLIVIE